VTLSFRSLALFLALAVFVSAAQIEGRPASTAPLDSDGDGIRNSIEARKGYRARGGSPRHKDIWIECDYMRGLRPARGLVAHVRSVFAKAPLKNPDGKPGIRVHLKIGNAIPFAKHWGDTSTAAGYEKTYERVMATRRTHLNGDRRYFHYCVFVNQISAYSSSGISMDSRTLHGGIPGDTFVVALGGAWVGQGGETAEFQAGTLVHELGHNLGLTHGGSGHGNYKPNYLSVMNYDFQFGFYGPDGDRVKRLKKWDYSRYIANALNENKLREPEGVRAPAIIARKYLGVYRCEGDNSPIAFDFNRAVDWNCDGLTNGVVKADINADRNTSRLVSQNNWRNLRWTGGAIGGGNDPPSVLERDELTLDHWLEIAPALPVRAEACDGPECGGE